MCVLTVFGYTHYLCFGLCISDYNIYLHIITKILPKFWLDYWRACVTTPPYSSSSTEPTKSSWEILLFQVKSFLLSAPTLLLNKLVQQGDSSKECYTRSGLQSTCSKECWTRSGLQSTCSKERYTRSVLQRMSYKKRAPTRRSVVLQRVCSKSVLQRACSKERLPKNVLKIMFQEANILRYIPLSVGQ